ncbi:hypothetical protein NQ315_000367, partial [Exocentrus adspersus]
FNNSVGVGDNVRSILDEILNDDQFVSGNENEQSISKEESLNIFKNIDLDDKSLLDFRNSDVDLNERNLFGGNFHVPLVRNVSDVDKRVKDFEELIAIKDSTIAALTSELDSFRELSNTNSVSIVSTTEYKQLQEECHNKLMEYNSAIIYKNDLIQQLSESLDQSVNERRELLKQVDVFKEEISQLQKQLQDATRMVNEHKCVKDTAIEDQNEEVCNGTETSEPVLDLKPEFSALECNLPPEKIHLVNNVKSKVKQSLKKNRSLYEEEIAKLKENIVLEKEDYESEIAKLRGLLANIKCGSTEIMELKQELEAKHSKEVEELRTYFEKKCADLEKNYSEEIFSQHSRKMSGSTCSEAELNSDVLFSHPPGPHGDISYDIQPNITKKDLTNLKNELHSILNKIDKYNLEHISEEDFCVLRSELGKCNLNNLLKYDLAIIRNDLQNKYHAELEVLREDNENKVDLLNLEYEKRLKSLEGRYLEEIEALKNQESDKRRDVESERNEAVDKIKVLRDIIRELELQVETKSAEVEECLNAIRNLECIVEQQERSINDLKQGDSFGDVSDIHRLRWHIESLEAELQQSRVNAELAGSEGALNQIRTQLCDLETCLDKKTKELEALHSTGTNCSSPSEDISARDLVPSTMDECEKKLTERDAKIEELNNEKAHLQELLDEKDKIINQISEDSHKLHVNLVTIQAKLKETGNIIDLGNKLKEEQKRTAELVEEIHNLKAQLLQYEMAKRNNPMTTSVDEITDQLKRELDYSAQIDSNILCAVSDHSLSSISESQDVEVYKKALTKEKSTRRHLLEIQDQLKKQTIVLEEKCASLQSLNEKLQCSLEKERSQLQQTQAEDTKLIEQMRIQLDAVLDHEEVLEKMLNDEKSARKQLESELESMRISSKTESTEYKRLPSKEAVELNQLKVEFEAVQEEKLQLSNEVKLLKQAKSEMESGRKYAESMLGMEVERTKSLEEKVQGLIANEAELREALVRKKIELEERLRDIQNYKIVMDEIEEERNLLRKQKEDLFQQLKTSALEEPQLRQSSPVPDVLLVKIKELNEALLDNRKLMEIIQKLTGDKRNLENELLIWKRQKASTVQFSDLVARSDFLFAKTLRLESIKKALIWQKRYLLDYLKGHQHHCLVEALPHAPVYRNKSKPRPSPKEKFRSTVYVVISILRMRYLVRRWHSGIRIAEKVNSRHYKHLPVPKQTGATFQAQFHVGQPVSSQFFSSNAAVTGSQNFFQVNRADFQDEDNAACGFDGAQLSPAGSNRSRNPWSGNTPPSKEESEARRIRIGSHILSKEDMTPLKAPQLLAQFVERFDQIQEKLGVALDSNAT